MKRHSREPVMNSSSPEFCACVHLTLSLSHTRTHMHKHQSGCCDEFRVLLDDYGRPGDTLILAGDLVNKGPKSAEVVRLARERGALAIVGNHELASLRARSRREGGAKPEIEPFYSWTDELSSADVDYLRKLPFRSAMSCVFQRKAPENSIRFLLVPKACP
jgi:hypothetical protein